MSTTDFERENAIKRLRARRAFFTHLSAYVVVNAGLFAYYAINDKGLDKPLWVLLGWGIGIAFHAWSALGRQQPTEAQIQAEIRRTRGSEPQ